MPSFSVRSYRNLLTCHKDLQTLFNEVIKHVDCTVTCGFRDRADQEAAFAAGTTHLHFPHGKHNRSPSIAVDVVPYPVDWSDTERFKEFAAQVKNIRDELLAAGKISSDIQWGYDLWEWDMPHWQIGE